MKALRNSLVPLALVFAAAPVSAAPCSFSGKCAAVGDILAANLPNSTTINASEFIAAGSYVHPSVDPTCESNRLAKPPSFDFCRVRMTSHTGPSSRVEIEGWLPPDWNGRFLGVGNGGLGGCIDFPALEYGAERNFAVFGTDNGHAGNTGKFFLVPGVLEDYSYRAVRVGAALGKQATELFYGTPHSKAYWLGCSTGGRQGFTEAQYFPDDYDGIVAGAPAFNQRSLQLWAGTFLTTTGPPGSPTFLSADLWKVVMQDILAQCDSLDGHVDGILESPDLCDYKPEHLICSPGQKSQSGCLTGLQAETVRKVYSPLYDNKGQLIFSALTMGADSTEYYWTGKLAAYALDQMRYIVYKDPSWNGTIGMKEIVDTLDTEVFALDAYESDLSGARDAGSKIIHYHGLQDHLIPSTNSDRYYNLVSRTMGLPPRDLDEFYRYFRISGMAHCRGGTGASNIGGRAGAVAGEKPDENVLAAMVQWVEEGKAPEYVLGTAFKDGQQTEVSFRRKHCKYPARNVYRGSGDPNTADSWECVF